MLKNLNAAALGPKRTAQVLMGVAGLVLLVGAVILFLMNSRIHGLQAQLNDKEALVGSNEQIAQRYQQTLIDYDATLTRTKFLEASVSAKSFVPTLLKQLQDLATTTHLTVTAVRPGPITTPTPPTPAAGTSGSGSSGDSAATESTVKKGPPPPYDTLDIEVDMTGAYADTATFLYGLTQFPKIISVASVQMHPGTVTDPKGQPASPSVTTSPLVATTLHLTAFVFHDGGAAGPSGTPADASPVKTAGSSTPPPGAPFRALPVPGVVSDAAAHAADRAVGASKSVQARSEVGIQTL